MTFLLLYCPIHMAIIWNKGFVCLLFSKKKLLQKKVKKVNLKNAKLIGILKKMERLKKSLSERIFLLGANQVTNDHWSFTLRGQSDKIYEQDLKPDGCTCSCPDFAKRKTFCKHLLFLIGRVAVQMEIAMKVNQRKTNWKENEFKTCSLSLVQRLKNRIKPPKSSTSTHGSGSDCSICFEEMKDNLTQCTTTCKNWFHNDCMKLWFASGKNSCPLCRSKWVKIVKEDNANNEDGEIEGTILEPDVVEETKQIVTDILFTFDTTGSMYPCLTEVRRNIDNITQKLFDEIPDLRIGLIAHGDYCDGDNLIETLDFTTDKKAIHEFITNAKSTYGGDYPEAYEYVLRETLKFDWRSDANMKSIVMIGDAPPHEKNENKEKIDWREEAEKLANRNVQIFSIQCLNYGNRESFSFYSQLARISNGYHLFLNQFSYIKDMLQAICYKQYDQSQAENFEKEIQGRSGGMNDSLRLMFDTILGRKNRDEIESEMHPDRYMSRYTRRSSSVVSRPTRESADPSMDREDELTPCLPTKFQVFDVTDTIFIKDFCQSMGITFKKGKGFYEFTKTEIVQPQKEIVLMKRDSGDLFEGDVARTIAGIPKNESRAKITPGNLPEYRIFIQSTSPNRKLISGQGFLYEVTF
jgi:hypothetical protein